MQSGVSGHKKLIEAVVDAYKLIHPEEYKLTCDAVRMKREMMKDREFGKMDDGGDDYRRPLFEISETLYSLLVQGLSHDCLMWWKTKEGSRWFAKRYMEFTLPEKV